MSYSTVLAKVKTVLEDVSNIGSVYDYARWAEDWGDFLNLFLISSPTDQIRGWEITRSASSEEARASRTNYRVHTFTIRGYMSLDDSAATEKDFQNLVDAVCTAFRSEPDLDGVALNVDPMQVNNVDFRMFGSVLCHFAELSLSVEEKVQWTES